MSKELHIKNLIKARREEILSIARAHGAWDVRIFGSTARGDAGPDSDVDFLVEFEEGRSLLDHAALLVDLESLLGRKVDVATLGSLKNRVRERVLKEAVKL